MAVRLVSEAHLLRYIELSDDRTLLTGLAFLFLGGGIAFLINLATATDQVPADAWAAFGLVTFAGLVFSFLAYRAGRRTRASRKHLWGSESDHAS
jgi:hypothetical protein